MVGIVIVTHSRELAESVVALAGQMLREKVPITSAGGVDDAEHPFGTDVSKIISAIESVYSDHGVLVLMDMGSAVLSAETAIEFLDEVRRSRVLLCEAPLVEGAVAAAVCAEGGGTLDQVSREARASLQPKGEQLRAGGEVGPIEHSSQGLSLPRMADGEVVSVAVVNPLGIHARPAAALVSTAARYTSTITIVRAGSGMPPVNARSINGVALLGARQGDVLELSAAGPDAHTALVELRKLVQSGFGEKDIIVRESGTAANGQDLLHTGELIGMGASPGVALAPCLHYKPLMVESQPRKAGDAEEEWQRLTTAIDGVKLELQHMMDTVTAAAGDEHGSMFHAHYLILEDEDFLQNIRTRVFTEAMSSEQAWVASVDELLQRYSRLESPYQRERGKDLEDLQWQVLAMLGEGQSRSFEPACESVVIAAELTPSDVAFMEGSRIVGICTAYGSPTSHSAILARALGIPAVVGLGPEILRVKEGSTVAVDGEAGSVWIDPDHVEALSARREKWLQTRREPAVIFRERVATADGKRIRICANISSVNEARRAVELGADGVGVLRTEFLFMRRVNAPSEQEQLETYASITEVMGARPLVIRTLDAGGDKPLPYIPSLFETSQCETSNFEANSFLGVRGIRLSLKHPELFETQLRAILRAGIGKDVSILLPMISSTDEVRQAREHLEQARRDLTRDHLPFSRDVKLGIMIEVPAAALIAGHLAKEVDFMSIGTNDLSQYVLSADRGSEQLSSMCDPLHPAVLRLISETARACRGSGIWTGVCGEVASDRCALPLLLGLGIDELSMNPFAVPGIKKEVSELESVKTSSIAAEALKLSTGREVRHYVAEALGVPCEETGSC